ncbi:MAG TPA: putative porin [Methylophilaceae bacterium]
MKNNRPNVFQLKPLLALLVIAQCAGTAQAGERESLEQLRATTTSLINALVQEGVLSKEKADALLKKASQDAAELANSTDNTTVPDADANSAPKNVRVQLVPEFVKAQMREDIKKEVMAKAQSEGWAYPGSIPDWLSHIEWEGDMRLRYESDRFSNTNPPPVFFNTDPLRNSNIKNTTEDRDRLRLRARLGANIKVNEWLSGGIRMTTGSVDDPVSPNQTESAATGKYTFSLDRAFLKASIYPWLSVSGGRFANPFYSTDLVWDPDLAFDGVAASFTPKVNNRMSVFGTLGAFPIEEVNTSNTNLAQNKWLFGGQGGINWKMYDKATVKIGLAYYDFEDVEGVSNGSTNNATFYDATVPAFRQKGNNTFNINSGNNLANSSPKFGLASQFKELNLTGQIDLSNFEPVHVILTGDYVNNIGFDQQEMLRRTGNLYEKENQGYQVRLAVGMPNTYKKNDWQVWGAYKRLEADSVLDGFTDSDFHLGGTDAKGWILGASYGLDKNAWMTARWFSSEAVSGLSKNQLPLSIDVLMLDLNAKF